MIASLCRSFRFCLGGFAGTALTGESFVYDPLLRSQRRLRERIVVEVPTRARSS